MRRPLRSTLILNARINSLPSIKNAKAQSFLGLRVNIRRTMFLSYLYASHALMVKIMVVGLLKNYLATYAHLRDYHKLSLRAQPQLQAMAMQAGPSAVQEGVKALGNSYVENQRQQGEG